MNNEYVSERSNNMTEENVPRTLTNVLKQVSDSWAELILDSQPTLITSKEPADSPQQHMTWGISPAGYMTLQHKTSCISSDRLQYIVWLSIIFLFYAKNH